MGIIGIINTLHWLPVSELPDLQDVLSCLNCDAGAGPFHLGKLCTWTSMGLQ